MRAKPFWKVYHFAGYFQRKAVAIFFDEQAASDFVSQHGREISPNGCYIAAIYPKRKAA